ncbi:MAG: Crp/Fnr family transcriptional regulator [bacterium]
MVSETTRLALLRAGTDRHYRANEVLYLANTPATGIQLIIHGRVRLMRGGSVRPVMIHDEVAGGCLGEVPLFEGTTYPATAIASEPTRCLFLSRSTVLAAVRADPELALAILAQLARRVRTLVDSIERSANHSTLGRLADRLLMRATASRGATVTLGATQQVTAEEIGTVREVVVRGLRALRDQGVIRSTGGGKYQIIDESALHRIARS